MKCENVFEIIFSFTTTQYTVGCRFNLQHRERDFFFIFRFNYVLNIRVWTCSQAFNECNQHIKMSIPLEHIFPSLLLGYMPFLLRAIDIPILNDNSHMTMMILCMKSSISMIEKNNKKLEKSLMFAYNVLIVILFTLSI